MSLNRFFLALAMAMTLLCASGAPARGNWDICVQLKWFHQSQFAGFYTALEEGYYRDRGLNVRLVEGGPAIDWQKKLSDPDCPIGVTNPEEIIRARVDNVQVKAVAAIDQVSPIVIFSLKSSSIWAPGQLKGRSLAMVPTGRMHVIGVLGKVGLGFDDIRLRRFSVEMSALYNGSVDAWSGYYTNLVTRAERDGHEISVIHPIDYGIQVYDDVVYVNSAFLKRSPDIVRRFLEATLEGWMKAIREPELAARHSMKYAPGASYEHQLALLLSTIPYVHTGEVPIGWMDGGVWEDMVELAYSAGLVRLRVPAADIYDDGILRRYYGGQKTGGGRAGGD